MAKATLISRLAQTLKVINLGASLGDKLALAAGYGLSRVGRPSRARVRFGSRVWPIVLYSGFDRTVLYEMLVLDEYARARAPDPAVILDVGANVGFSTLYLASRFPEAVIHAFEPSPDSYAKLRENTAGVPNIITHQLALGGSDGEAEFWVSARHYGSSLLRREGTSAVPVRVSTLDSFLTEQGIDRVGLLKFDIEGAEIALLSGLGDPSRVEQFIGEIHYDLIEQGPAWFRERLPGFEMRERPSGNQRTVLHAWKPCA